MAERHRPVHLPIFWWCSPKKQTKSDTFCWMTAWFCATLCNSWCIPWLWCFNKCHNCFLNPVSLVDLILFFSMSEIQMLRSASSGSFAFSTCCTNPSKLFNTHFKAFICSFNPSNLTQWCGILPGVLFNTHLPWSKRAVSNSSYPAQTDFYFLLLLVVLPLSLDML